jgi:mevalonate kinase
MGKGSGFGKVILFGEHFVVHGVPGIVSAIDSSTEAEVRKTGSQIVVKDERKTAKGYSQEKRLQQLESIDRMLKKMGINQETALEIWIGGKLPGFSGLGASAASSVAIARAIAETFKMQLTDEQINNIAYEGEKAYAGTPSGIDNTAATFGGLLWFQKDMTGNSNSIETLHIREPIDIIIGSTGIVANTKAMVEGVADRKAKSAEKYNAIFRRAEEIAFEGKKALLDFNLDRVGELMNENHHLLQQIGVSHEILDRLVEISIEQGAYGAKLTGGGGGGCMTALTPGKTLQKKVANAIESEGFEILSTRIGIEKTQGRIP